MLKKAAVGDQNNANFSNIWTNNANVSTLFTAVKPNIDNATNVCSEISVYFVVHSKNTWFGLMGVSCVSYMQLMLIHEYRRVVIAVRLRRLRKVSLLTRSILALPLNASHINRVQEGQWKWQSVILLGGLRSTHAHTKIKISTQKPQLMIIWSPNTSFWCDNRKSRRAVLRLIHCALLEREHDYYCIILSVRIPFVCSCAYAFAIRCSSARSQPPSVHVPLLSCAWKFSCFM